MPTLHTRGVCSELQNIHSVDAVTEIIEHLSVVPVPSDGFGLI